MELGTKDTRKTLYNIKESNSTSEGIMQLLANLTLSISNSQSSRWLPTSSSRVNQQEDLLPFYGLTISSNVHPKPAECGQFQTPASSLTKLTSTLKPVHIDNYSKTSCPFPTNKWTLLHLNAWLQINNRNGSACSLNTTMRSLKYPFLQFNLYTILGRSIIF